MKFEVYSDVHASSIAPRGEMYFSHSFVKVQDYSAYLRREGAEFSVCLGDICEYTGNAEIDDPALSRALGPRMWGRHPYIHVLGNHDVAFGTKAEFAERMKHPLRPRPGMPANFRFPELPTIPVTPANSPYFSFVQDGWKFVVLDTNYDETGASIENKLIRGITYINKAQLDWLSRELSDGMRTIILTHANLDPRMVDGKMHPCVLGNAAEVRAILEKAGNVKLVLQGHAHDGACTYCAGIPYITLRATVLGQYPESYAVAVVELTDEGIHIQGFVSQPSYDIVF